MWGLIYFLLRITVIPIVESMQRPERFPFVLTLGMIIVCVIYILIGTISYLAYGDTIQSAVIYNFPPDNKLTITVKILYSLAICLTAPLMLFPALKIIEKCIFSKSDSGKDSVTIKWSKNIYRTILCILCAAIAFGIGGDNLDKFVSLVGSIACVPLCFIFPGMFHLKVSNKRQDVILNFALITFGVVVMIFTLVKFKLSRDFVFIKILTFFLFNSMLASILSYIQLVLIQF